jgi:hypothetical protein
VKKQILTITILGTAFLMLALTGVGLANNNSQVESPKAMPRSAPSAPDPGRLPPCIDRTPEPGRVPPCFDDPPDPDRLPPVPDNPPPAAPEIDRGSGAKALALLAGGLLVVRGRREDRVD